MSWTCKTFIFSQKRGSDISSLSLELNIHQQILYDIASNAGDTADDLLYANHLIASKIETKVNEDQKHPEVRVFMVCLQLFHSYVIIDELLSLRRLPIAILLLANW